MLALALLLLGAARATAPVGWLPCGGATPVLCAPDADGDEFGSIAGVECRAVCLPGQVACEEIGCNDCDDAHETARPGGREVCDGLDNDCDGETDEDRVCQCDDCFLAETGRVTDLIYSGKACRSGPADCDCPAADQFCNTLLPVLLSDEQRAAALATLPTGDGLCTTRGGGANLFCAPGETRTAYGCVRACRPDDVDDCFVTARRPDGRLRASCVPLAGPLAPLAGGDPVTHVCTYACLPEPLEVQALPVAPTLAVGGNMSDTTVAPTAGGGGDDEDSALVQAMWIAAVSIYGAIAGIMICALVLAALWCVSVAQDTRRRRRDGQETDLMLD